MASQLEVAQVVAMIGSAYPNFSPNKETVSVYYELLKDLPLDLLRAAALQCCAESGRKFAPSVGELRGAAAEINRKAENIPSALEAWREVCKAPKAGGVREFSDEIDEHGRMVFVWHEYKWSHPLVEKIARLLGFPDFPNSDNESVDRAHFFKQYEQALKNCIDEAIELPEVTRYIENRRSGKTLPIGQVVKRLSR